MPPSNVPLPNETARGAVDRCRESETMRLEHDWRIKVLIAVAPTLIVLMVLCMVGEVAVRYHERHRSTVPGTMPSLFYRHGQLGYALVRDFDYFGWVHVNAQGFRGRRPTSLVKEPGTVRIMAVGASTTFDTFVSADSATWPARLEKALSALVPGQKFEVINAGVPGYAIDQSLIRLETELYAYKPDLLILYQNDLLSGIGAATSNPTLGDDEHRPREVATVTPWMGWLEAHSLLYGKLKQRFIALTFTRRVRAPGASSAHPGSLIEPGAQRFEQRLKSYLAVARAFGIPVVLAEAVHVSGNSLHETDSWRLTLWRSIAPFPTDSVLAGYQRYNAELRTVAESAGVAFIPMSDLGIAGTEYYASGEPIHFNDRGAWRFADGLARRLLERHAIPRVDDVAKTQPRAAGERGYASR